MDVLGRNRMRDVNDLNMWIDIENHAFHDAEVGVVRSKIGRQRDNAGMRIVDWKSPPAVDFIFESVPK